VLVGSDQGNRRHVERLAEDWGLRSQTHFLGFVTRPELVALYRKAAALTYPTFFGPENLPPLEAFALGCPVVASRVAGAEEQLGDAALLADPHVPDELAQAVAAVLRDPALRGELARRGQARAGRFTGDDFVRGVIRLIDEFESVRRCWGPNSAA
jgi:glycosyltransferase involved in cell wall biosynthesis